jgi:hypothetical protein
MRIAVTRAQGGLFEELANRLRRVCLDDRDWHGAPCRLTVAVEECRCEVGDIWQLLGEMKAGQEAHYIPTRRGEGCLIEIAHVEIDAPVIATERTVILEMEIAAHPDARCVVERCVAR